MAKHEVSYQDCIRLMRHSDGFKAEEGFRLLLSRSAEFVDPLIEEYRNPESKLDRYWLMELITASKLYRIFPFYVSLLKTELDDGQKQLILKAIRELIERLGTKSALQVLYAIESFSFVTEKNIDEFVELLKAYFIWDEIEKKMTEEQQSVPDRDQFT